MLELIVDKGCLRPAGTRDVDTLRKMQLGLGQIVQAKIHQPRNPRFFRLAHQLGQLVRQNIEGFELLDGHQVLKRLQIESGVQCDEMQVRVPGVGPALVRVPKSIAFDKMDEAEFKDMMRNLSVYISAEYWENCSPEQIEQMAGAMPDET